MIRAKCQRLTGNTQHYIGGIRDGRLVQHTKIEDPDYVRIVKGDNGYYLFRYSVSERCLSDSWFESFEQAKRQAEFEFAISLDDWEIEP